jgi:hypothetical protein
MGGWVLIGQTMKERQGTVSTSPFPQGNFSV